MDLQTNMCGLTMIPQTAQSHCTETVSLIVSPDVVLNNNNTIWTKSK